LVEWKAEAGEVGVPTVEVSVKGGNWEEAMVMRRRAVKMILGMWEIALDWEGRRVDVERRRESGHFQKANVLVDLH
jgi:hypothetical protein